MRLLSSCLLLAILLFAYSCSGKDQLVGTADSNTQASQPVAASPAGTVEIFNAALPDEGRFNPHRVPAVSQLQLPGSAFDSASTGVSVQGSHAVFAPETELEFAIWRFFGTAQDSIGNINVAISDAEDDIRYWTAIANYGTDRWQWFSSSDDPAGNPYDVSGSAGEHSSSAGYIYVAVLTDAAADFSVDSVAIEYLERYDISGQVLDLAGYPIAGALLTTDLEDGQDVFSAADGSFSLSGIPDGTWFVMATKDGYNFPDNDIKVEVDGADEADVVLIGHPALGGGAVTDTHEPNNHLANAFLIDSGSLADCYISVLDDPVDFYSFKIFEPGWYTVRMRSDDGIYFPFLSLRNDAFDILDNSDSVLRGGNWVSYHFPTSRTYEVQVSCQAGAGSFSLDILPGRGTRLVGELKDSGNAGDGDDGLLDRAYGAQVQLEFADMTVSLATNNDSAFLHTHLPREEVTIRPLVPGYVIEPEQSLQDLSTGEVTGLDFNLSAPAADDPLEPNDDFADATAISMPMSQPLASRVGGYSQLGYDSSDYFSFQGSAGLHAMVRVSFTGAWPLDVDGNFMLQLFDASEASEFATRFDSLNHAEIRSLSPLTDDTYYLRINNSAQQLPYEVFIEMYEPRSLSSRWQVAGKDLDNGVMAFSLNDMYWNDSVEVSDGDAVTNTSFMDGDSVLVAYRRHGVEFEPAQHLVEFDGSDIQLTPVITYSSDSLEPNGSHAGAVPVTLPVSINASLDSTTDLHDYYRLQGQAAGPITVSMQPVDEDFSYTCNLRDSGGAVLQSHTRTGSAQIHFQLPATDDYSIQLTTSRSSSDYQAVIGVSPQPLYHVHGNLDHGKPAENYSDTYIVNHTTGEVFRTSNGDYSLGWLPDGSYDIQWFIANHDVIPTGVVTIIVDGAEVIQDFSAVYNYSDALEPNQGFGNEAAVIVPFEFSANLDGDNSIDGDDDEDNYVFTAPASGLFELTMTPWEFASGRRMDVTLSESHPSIRVAYGVQETGNDVQNLSWDVTVGETYYIEIRGGDDEQYNLQGAITVP